MHEQLYAVISPLLHELPRPQIPSLPLQDVHCSKVSSIEISCIRTSCIPNFDDVLLTSSSSVSDLTRGPLRLRASCYSATSSCISLILSISFEVFYSKRARVQQCPHRNCSFNSVCQITSSRQFNIPNLGNWNVPRLLQIDEELASFHCHRDYERGAGNQAKKLTPKLVSA